MSNCFGEHYPPFNWVSLSVPLLCVSSPHDSVPLLLFIVRICTFLKCVPLLPFMVCVSPSLNCVPLLPFMVCVSPSLNCVPLLPFMVCVSPSLNCVPLLPFMVCVSTSLDRVPFLNSHDQLIVYLCVPAGAGLSKVSKGVGIMITELFFHIVLKRTEVLFIQEVTRVYTSPFLDTDKFEMALRAEKFPGFSRNGPLVCDLTERKFQVFIWLLKTR